MPTEAVPQAELEKHRRRVEGMGPVNLAAPEEHAQLEERYNFLLSQQQDLVKAKEDLLSTVQKINASTRQNFRETFDKVRENFKAIYGQLFPGGEADVRLTDEADILNAGVDIFAQPPGKKLMNITLLSGGEKALTAVALLFAFFMVRPAPFAVLDEVDAPLDEANVTRFITLIKAFTDQSQFIMITHNKRSMETADTPWRCSVPWKPPTRSTASPWKSRASPESCPPALKTLEDRPQARSPETVLSADGGQGFLMANPERALADKVFLERGLSVTSRREMEDYLFKNLRLDPERIMTMDPDVLTLYGKRGGSRKVRLVAEVVRSFKGLRHE
jgi:hypothetical protein